MLQAGGLKSLLVLLPGLFNRFGTLLGRSVARGDIGTDVIEDSPGVGSQYLVHGTLQPFRSLDLLRDFL